MTGTRLPAALPIALGVAMLLGVVLLYESGGAPAPRSLPRSAPDALEDGWAGKPAPEFALRSLDGKLVRLSQFRGKTVLVNFWATWCAPCRVEMPWLAALYDRYRGRGIEIIGVAMDDGDRDRVVKFVHETRVGYSIVLKDQAVGAAYGGARFLPQSFLVGPDGRVLAHMIGIRSKENLQADIVSAPQFVQQDAGS